MPHTTRQKDKTEMKQPRLAPAPILNDPSLMLDEGTRAQHWRVIMGLSIKDLSELTGYSVTAIRCFEANANTAGELFSAAAWQRYRNTCHGVVWQAAIAPIEFSWTLSVNGAVALLEGK